MRRWRRTCASWAAAVAVALRPSGRRRPAAKVVIMEKCGILGGSTNVSGGALNAVDPYRQDKQGIEDSVEQFYQSTLEGGHNVGDPELVEFLTSHAMESVEWLEEIGCAFKMKIGSATGSLGERSHYTVKPAGSGYTDAFRRLDSQQSRQSHGGEQHPGNRIGAGRRRDGDGREGCAR